jgi:predicted signal transduction protein with EAL and GGDEF domain
MVSLPLSPKLPPFPLGITVVAEGVETSKQVTQLRRLGCNLAYFSERLTSGAASKFLAAAFGYPGDRKAD